MTRILRRAFGAVALVGVAFALAACAAQSPERETGATTVSGAEVGVAQISQPVTTVGGLGAAKAVIPVPDLKTQAQETTASASIAIQQTSTVTTPAVEDASTLIVGPT